MLPKPLCSKPRRGLYLFACLWKTTNTEMRVNLMEQINHRCVWSCLTMFTTIARFIWNAEISVSVAIHCYERLF